MWCIGFTTNRPFFWSTSRLTSREDKEKAENEMKDLKTQVGTKEV